MNFFRTGPETAPWQGNLVVVAALSAAGIRHDVPCLQADFRADAETLRERRESLDRGSRSGLLVRYAA